MPLLGSHMSIAGGLPLAVDRAVANGCEALQIFTKSSNQWRARTLEHDGVREFRARAERASLSQVVAHASYLINLGAPDPALRQHSIDAFGEEIDRAEALGLVGVVIHPGAYTTGTEARGLRLVAGAVSRLLRARKKGRTLVILEHTAGQGTSLGWRFEHLARMLEHLDGHPRVAVCLDTCHLWAAGYDLASRDGYRDTFETFDRLVGLDRLRVFHVNDSKKDRGSRRDRHDHIGKGTIGLEAFGRLLHDPRFDRLPMILETPKTEWKKATAVAVDPLDQANFKTLRALIAAPPPDATRLDR